MTPTLEQRGRSLLKKERRLMPGHIHRLVRIPQNTVRRRALLLDNRRKRKYNVCKQTLCEEQK